MRNPEAEPTATSVTDWTWSNYWGEDFWDLIRRLGDCYVNDVSRGSSAAMQGQTCPLSMFSYAVWCFLEGCHKSRQFSLGYPDYPKGHVDFVCPNSDFFQQIRGSFWGPKDWITSCQVRRECTVQKRLTLLCFGAHLHFVVPEHLGIRIMPWCSWTPT